MKAVRLFLLLLCPSHLTLESVGDYGLYEGISLCCDPFDEIFEIPLFVLIICAFPILPN